MGGHKYHAVTPTIRRDDPTGDPIELPEFEWNE